MANLNGYQRDQLKKERSMTVNKRNDMVQTARYRLSIQEQRTILYAISKIKPDDTYLTEYTFDINEFFKIIGWEKQSYTEFKLMLKNLSDKSWWAEIDDKGTESVLRWFSSVKSNRASGKVMFKFHEDMMPFLINLIEQGEFYTSYELKYILPMTSKHSPRLYEILKSYQRNNSSWFFDIDELKRLMDCENYNNFKDFRVRALDPAVEEINKYTDILVTYDAKKEGRKVTRIVFQFDEKTQNEKYATDNEIELALDGQLSLFEMVDEVRNSNASEFIKQRVAAHRAEPKEK